MSATDWRFQLLVDLPQIGEFQRLVELLGGSEKLTPRPRLGEFQFLVELLGGSGKLTPRPHLPQLACYQ
jgi:hypothetical protein